MKKIIYSFTVFIASFLVMNCKGPAGWLPRENDVSVSWELISNNRTERSFFTAEFIIVNNSHYEFDTAGWTLFFNQLTGTIIPGSITGEVNIDHVNGDLFTMTPADGFRLLPKDTATIRYDGRGWIIKRTEAPQGLFFVFTDKEDEDRELATVPVKDYTIKPFPDLERVFPLMGEAPLPTPEWQYEINKATNILEKNKLLKVIPSPAEITGFGSKVILKKELMIHYEEGLENETQLLAGLLEKLMGNEPVKMKSSVNGPDIIALKVGDTGVFGKKKETYRLESSADRGVIITGGDAAGVFYGIQSLLALMPVEALHISQPEIEIDAVSISDAPAFEYRGMHLDLARNFNSKNAILRMIEVMSFYKLNRLHLHLTDDEGWRLEIEELPELTEIGGYRGHIPGDKKYLSPAYGSGPYPDPVISYGSGFLSREDFKEILRFAHEHHIEVIPEINMPGHARAAIKAMEVRYKRLTAEGKQMEAEEFRLIDPSDTSKYSSAQNYDDNVVCVCKESVYNFYKTVVEDIIQIYEEAGVPLTTIHTGGDEVPESVWQGSPICAQLLMDNPAIESAWDLQAYFFGRLVKILEEHNLVAAGWEEVAMKSLGQQGWTPNPEFVGRKVLPFVWNSLGNNLDLGYRLANAGYPVVLCNVTNYYFDLAYNHHPEEPGLYWGGFVDTRKAYEFIPFDLYKSLFTNIMNQPINQEVDFKDMERLKPEAKKNILGLQGQLWSETVKGQDMMEYLYLPKMIGLAERAWAGQAEWGTITDIEERIKAINEDWNIFANSVGQMELPRLDYLFGGFSYRIPPPGAVIEDGQLLANITFPGLQIRYTTDGSEPDHESTLYEGSLAVTGTVKLKSFDTLGRGSRTVEVK